MATPLDNSNEPLYECAIFTYPLICRKN